MSRVAIVGPGSVGTFFAAHLAAAGNEVLACARRPFARYIVESTEAPVTAPAHVVTNPAEVTHGPYPFVLVAVKAHQSAEAAPWFARLCGPETVVVAIQNGVESEARLQPLCPRSTVVPAVVYCGAELVEPGHIRHYNRSTLMLPNTPAAHRLVELFAGTPTDVRAIDSYLTEAWRKLALNVVVNGITALTERRMSVMAEPLVAELGATILRETYAVGRAEGADLRDEAIPKLIAGLAEARGDGGTSMLYDRLAGRPLEYDALYGAVIRAGQRHGLPTPTNAALAALLSGLSQRSSALTC